MVLVVVVVVVVVPRGRLCVVMRGSLADAFCSVSLIHLLAFWRLTLGVCLVCLCCSLLRPIYYPGYDPFVYHYQARQ